MSLSRVAIFSASLTLPAVAAALAVVASLAVAPHAFGAVNTSYHQIVAFGDSLSDVGNLNTADGGVGPNGANNYATGEFTDGPSTTPAVPVGGPEGVWVQQLNALLGLPALTASLAGGFDYAYGGAVTGGAVSYSGFSVPGMQNQVGTYLSSVSGHVPANNLYVFWGGANDIFNAAAAGATGAAVDAAASQAAANIDGEIQSLYNAGGRDFLWLNLPPLDKTPGSTGNTELADATTVFNNAFSTDVTGLNAAQTFGHVTGIDINALTSELLTDPSKYGLTNVTNSAQDLTGINPDTYLFWDGAHPTTAGDALIAQRVFQQVVPEPATLGLLALGGVPSLLPRRRCAVSLARSAANPGDGSC
jgi:outer membrane lipase/esterase